MRLQAIWHYQSQNFFKYLVGLSDIRITSKSDLQSLSYQQKSWFILENWRRITGIPDVKTWEWLLKGMLREMIMTAVVFGTH